jgi:hypothetical protein
LSLLLWLSLEVKRPTSLLAGNRDPEHMLNLDDTVTMMILFWGAKKRQWKIKEGLRKSARKVSSAVKAVTTPLTPKKMTFSPILEKKNRGVDKFIKAKRDMPSTRLQKAPGQGQTYTATVTGNSRDLEKGLPDGGSVKVIAGGGDKSESSSLSGPAQVKKDRKRPRPPSVSIPSSAFEMESPKTPMWVSIPLKLSQDKKQLVPISAHTDTLSPG